MAVNFLNTHSWRTPSLLCDVVEDGMSSTLIQAPGGTWFNPTQIKRIATCPAYAGAEDIGIASRPWQVATMINSGGQGDFRDCESQEEAERIRDAFAVRVNDAIREAMAMRGAK